MFPLFFLRISFFQADFFLDYLLRVNIFQLFFFEFHVFKLFFFLDYLFRVASVDSKNMHLEDNVMNKTRFFFIMPCMLNVCFSPLQKVV